VNDWLLFNEWERRETERALVFAGVRHAGQVRRGIGEPYINHPTRVAQMVSRTACRTTAMMVTALLHDVLEDTVTTPQELTEYFGPEVSWYVQLLTDVGGGNRESRMSASRRRLGASSWQVQTIKLADSIDNTASIVEVDPKFARVYLTEKELLLPYLRDGDAVLWARLKEQIAEQWDKLRTPSRA
jgi:(p)ppGpp synthase/HD superfamily hydrolase